MTGKKDPRHLDPTDPYLQRFIGDASDLKIEPVVTWRLEARGVLPCCGATVLLAGDTLPVTAAVRSIEHTLPIRVLGVSSIARNGNRRRYRLTATHCCKVLPTLLLTVERFG